MASPCASKDVFFERALGSLPPPLLSALQAAELTDPGVLRLYPQYTATELGLPAEVVHVDQGTAQSGSTSSCIPQSMLHIGAAEAANSTSSCHELDVVVSGVTEHFHCWLQTLPLRGELFHPVAEKEIVRDVTEKRLLHRVFVATQSPNRLHELPDRTFSLLAPNAPVARRIVPSSRREGDCS